MTGQHVAPRTMAPFDAGVPHSARTWNYWHGGKDNFQANRDAAASFTEIYPQVVDVVRASRQLLGRVVTHLTADLGVRQFLDLGVGVRTADPAHQLAQRVAVRGRPARL